MLLPLAATAAPAVDTGAPTTYPFGMCSDGKVLSDPAYPRAILDAGAKMVRADFTFPNVRPTPEQDPDKWDWKSLDSAVELSKQFPALQWCAILGYGTSWAGSGTAGSGINSPQRGIDVRPVDDPGNLYGRYVYETVRRYHGAIHVWESWNEPDLPGNGFFAGNGADFLPYQRACYLAAKKADPTCSVLFAGMSYGSVEGYLSAHALKPPTPYPPKASFFEEYLQAAVKDPEARKNNFYFDVMNQHSYSRASDLYDYPEVDMKLMRDYIGEEKPVWVTEMGIPDTGGMFGCSPDEYGDYLLQSYAWGKLAGVQKFFHFQLDNSNGLGLYLSVPDQPKPALSSYRLLTKLFAGATLIAQRHGNAGVGLLQGNSPYDPSRQQGYDLFQFTTGNRGNSLWMAFADGSSPVDITIPAHAESTVLIDRMGNKTRLTASGGVYRVHLNGATNVAGWPTGDDKSGKSLGSPEHLVGGATVVLEERSE